MILTVAEQQPFINIARRNKLYSLRGDEEEVITPEVFALARNMAILDSAVDDQTARGVEMEDCGGLQIRATEVQIIRVDAEKGVGVVAAGKIGLREETEGLRGAAGDSGIGNKSDC